MSRSDCCAPEIRAYTIGLLTGKHRGKNMERMEETVAGFCYHNVQNAITDSPWDARAVMDEVARRADGLLGGSPRPRLVLDDSGFQKKGDKSVGVARQYLGRLGKIDNGQVAVCTSLAAGQKSTLVDLRLYLPEVWCESPKRCEVAQIPEAERHFRTKAELALEIVNHQRQLGVRFDVVSMDSGYGSDPGLLRHLDAAGETYVAEVHCDQRIWQDHPWPHQESVRGRGKTLKQPRASQASQRVDEWSRQQPELDWARLKVRESDQGWVEVSYIAQRVWVMEADQAWPVWLLAWENPDERCNDGSKPKGPRRHYALSNAPAESDARILVGDALGRNVVERNFREAKTDVGMADYQVRGWVAWHHHMAVVLMAMLFLTQERMHQGAMHTAEGIIEITTGDIVFMLEKLLPQRGRGPVDEGDAKNLLAKRIAKRKADQIARRRKTCKNRPPLWPDEIL